MNKLQILLPSQNNSSSGGLFEKTQNIFLCKVMRAPSKICSISEDGVKLGFLSLFGLRK